MKSLLNSVTTINHKYPNIFLQAMNKIHTTHFNLEHTIESGQVFRFEKTGNTYALAVQDKLLLLRQEGSTLHYDGANKKFVTNLLALDEDYEAILASIDRDHHINAAFMECLGMRIMRQDPWECLVSFVCSSNSNIPRIRQNLHTIAREFGKPMKLGGHSSHTFPLPHQINDLKKLKLAKLGYREKFVHSLAKKVKLNQLNSLSKLPYEKAKEKLTALPGVGPKVADCVLLFSLGHTNAFPVDVWIDRAMKQIYSLDQKLPPHHIQTIGSSYFGTHAGYAQQFIYHWSRTNKHLFTEKIPKSHERNHKRKA